MAVCAHDVPLDYTMLGSPSLFSISSGVVGARTDLDDGFSQSPSLQLGACRYGWVVGGSRASKHLLSETVDHQSIEIRSDLALIIQGF